MYIAYCLLGGSSNAHVKTHSAQVEIYTASSVASFPGSCVGAGSLGTKLLALEKAYKLVVGMLLWCNRARSFGDIITCFSNMPHYTIIPPLNVHLQLR